MHFDAKQIYRGMCGFDTAPVLRFLRRESPSVEEGQAKQLVDALLQWMAGHAADPHEKEAYVMMSGGVDNAFHAFILNTRLYMDFCASHVGFFIHHTPLDSAGVAEGEVIRGVRYTTNFLKEAFGDDLAPELAAWVGACDRGELKASAVSCLWGLNASLDPAVTRHFGATHIVEYWRGTNAA